MKRLRAGKARKPARKKYREPLAEGAMKKRKKRPNGFFSKMSDDELVNRAKRLMKENKISWRVELQKADSGLYDALRKRKLLDRVDFEEIIRNWSSLSHAQLVEHTRKFMEKRGISGKEELRKADNGLYYALQRRKLLDKVGFEEARRDWESFSDEQLVEHTRKFMEKRGISSRGELQKADYGLYSALRKRRLPDLVGFEGKRRDWSSLSDEQLVEHARQVMEEKGIGRRSELEKADSGLYDALRKRKLLDLVGFEDKLRDWSSLSDEQLVEHARQFMEEKGINYRGELQKADYGLYEALWKRELLDTVGFEEKHRKWRPFSDAELVEHARQFMEKRGISGKRDLEKVDNGLYLILMRRKLLDKVGFEERRRRKGYWDSFSDTQLVDHTRKFMEEKGINGRYELQKADSGLYRILWKKCLLDKVGFERLQRNWMSLSDEQLIEHARQFMEKNGINGRKELQKADNGLYKALRKRKLLDRIGFEKKIREGRGWSSFSDEQLVEHARRFMEKNGINGRWKLKKADNGLYTVLQKRKLLDRVFADIERAREREKAQALLDACMEFGGAE